MYIHVFTEYMKQSERVFLFHIAVGIIVNHHFEEKSKSGEKKSIKVLRNYITNFAIKVFCFRLLLTPPTPQKKSKTNIKQNKKQEAHVQTHHMNITFNFFSTMYSVD